MNTYTESAASETKRLIKWIGQNPVGWECICGKGSEVTSYLDTMEVVQDLQEKELFP